MKLNTTSKLAAVLVAAVALTSAANAASFIKGGIIIAGFGTANVNMTANTVAFSPASPAVNAIVTSSTLDFATLAPSPTFGTYNDFTYQPLSVTNPIWTFGNVSFDLNSVTSITETAAGVVLSGYGVAKDLTSTLMDTPGSWSFSANQTGQVFGWSSTANVPDGGTTVALLGVSLLGLHGLRRKFAK